MSSTESSSAGSESSLIDVLNQWIVIHPVSFYPSEWLNTRFSRFISGLRYPKRVLDETLMKLITTRMPDKARHQLLFLKHWQSNLGAEQLDEGDRYEFELWYMYIYASWLSFWSRLKDDDSLVRKRGVEKLVELAFQLRAGANQVWRPDADMALSHSGVPDKVRADCVVTMDIPVDWQANMEVLCNNFVFSWSYANTLDTVVTFVFLSSEDNSDESRIIAWRRLQMCFYSAQMQRRALCCKDGPVFGALLHDKILELFVSFWNKGVLKLKTVLHDYSLDIASDFVEAYFALCRISEFVAEGLEKEFKRWDEVSSRWNALRRTAKHPWRREVSMEMEAEVTSSSSDEYEWEDVEEIVGATTMPSRALNSRQANHVPEGTGSPSPQGAPLPLTRMHKKAFDRITNADRTEEVHSLFVPSIWSEETYNLKNEYEDPAPYSGDGSKPRSASAEPHDTPSDGSCHAEIKAPVENGPARKDTQDHSNRSAHSANGGISNEMRKVHNPSGQYRHILPTRTIPLEMDAVRTEPRICPYNAPRRKARSAS